MAKLVPWRPASQLLSLSALDLLISAATFSSLGVVLPHMVQELEWNWSQAGLGFTLLGACCGGSSLLPPILIRQFGVRATLVIGALLMAGGLYTLHEVRSLLQYFVGAAICGVSFQMMAGIPATFVLSRVFERRAAALGLYGTIGGFGNVVGPWLVLGVLAIPGQDWRDYWLYQAMLLAVFGVLCALVIGLDARFARPAKQELEAPPQAAPAQPRRLASGVYRTQEDWSVKEAVGTFQFYVLVAAYFANLLALVTVTSLSVGHLVERGVSTTTAGAMLSLEAFIAVLARAATGFLGDHVDPRLLMTIALGMMAAGCFVLAFSLSQPYLLIYAVGTGIGFGATQLCCTVLALNYFGQRHNLEIFSLMLLVGAASALGPLAGGVLRDLTGSFMSAFVLIGAIVASVWVAVLAMRPPLKAAPASRPAEEGQPAFGAKVAEEPA